MEILIQIARRFAGVILFTAVSVASADPAFLRGADGRIHGLVFDRGAETSTRRQLKVLNACQMAKTRATAMTLAGSDAATMTVRIQSQKGLVTLESRPAGAASRMLDTELGGAYKNFPTFMHAEPTRSTTRNPLTITLAALFSGQGDMVLRKGDSITIRADGRIDRYMLPTMTIPAGGMLTLYPGTDDVLYFDAGLKHPLHEGVCKNKAK